MARLTRGETTAKALPPCKPVEALLVADRINEGLTDPFRPYLRLYKFQSMDSKVWIPKYGFHTTAWEALLSRMSPIYRYLKQAWAVVQDLKQQSALQAYLRIACPFASRTPYFSLAGGESDSM